MTNWLSLIRPRQSSALARAVEQIDDAAAIEWAWWDESESIRAEQFTNWRCFLARQGFTRRQVDLLLVERMRRWEVVTR